MSLLRASFVALLAFVAISGVAAGSDCSLKSLTLYSNSGPVVYTPTVSRTAKQYFCSCLQEQTQLYITAAATDPSASMSLQLPYSNTYYTIKANRQVGPFQLTKGAANVFTIQVTCTNCQDWFKIDCNFGGVHGDPVFTGLRGQEYQVHGVAGQVYNILSDAEMQFNSRFVFRTSGKCPVVNGVEQKNCWSHPGTYLGEIGIKTPGGDRIHLVSGSAEKGYGKVQVNGVDLLVGDELKLSNGYIARNSTHMVRVQASVFEFHFENSDWYINQELRVTDWSSLAAHGLLGQTWQKKTYKGTIKAIEGDVDDYMIQDGELFGDDFVFNRFKTATA